MGDEKSHETEIALLKLRVETIESELKAVKAWGFKAAIGVIGTVALSYWDKLQVLLRIDGR